VRPRFIRLRCTARGSNRTAAPGLLLLLRLDVALLRPEARRPAPGRDDDEALLLLLPLLLLLGCGGPRDREEGGWRDDGDRLEDGVAPPAPRDVRGDADDAARRDPKLNPRFMDLAPPRGDTCLRRTARPPAPAEDGCGGDAGALSPAVSSESSPATMAPWCVRRPSTKADGNPDDVPDAAAAAAAPAAAAPLADAAAEEGEGLADTAASSSSSDAAPSAAPTASSSSSPSPSPASLLPPTPLLPPAPSFLSADASSIAPRLLEDLPRDLLR